jgi:hypothetical protein
MGAATRENSDEFYRALGEAVVRHWSQLPHDVQRLLFKQTVRSRGEQLRPPLAVFLHDQHPRTWAAIRDRMLSEPDSLGG